MLNYVSTRSSGSLVLIVFKMAASSWHLSQNSTGADENLFYYI